MGAQERHEDGGRVHGRGTRMEGGCTGKGYQSHTSAEGYQSHTSADIQVRVTRATLQQTCT